MTQPILSIRNLKLRLGENDVINSLDLDVEPKTFHAVIGPNGAGKSTLFNTISGGYRSQTGSILFKGVETGKLSTFELCRIGIARSFQITSIFPQMTVFENMRIGILAKRRQRFVLHRLIDNMNEITEKANECLEMVGLLPRKKRLAGDLTYSEQRALELALTVSLDCDLILLDEPTAGMSNEESMRTVELIKRVAMGKTLVIVEHDMDVVFSLCDKISVVTAGKVLATGLPDQIRANSAVQAAYLGELSPAC